MLVTASGYQRCDRRNPLHAVRDDVRDFVTRDPLGYGPTRMAEVFQAERYDLYESDLFPEQAVHVVVWNAAIEDLLAEHAAGRDQLHFDFERSFLGGFTLFDAVQEALGSAICSASDLERADDGALSDGR